MYVVVSGRVGIPGTEYVPRPGTDVAALVAGGHIVEVQKDSPEPQPPRKVRPKTPKE